MAEVKYLNEDGLRTLVDHIKRRTTSVYKVKGEAIYADADYVTHAQAEEPGYVSAINATGLWKNISGVWTNLNAFDEGYVYSILNDFVTDGNFVEGAGSKINAGTNIVVVNSNTTADPIYKWDLFASALQLDDYQVKKLVTPLNVFGNETTVEYTSASELPTTEEAATAEIKNNMIAVIGKGSEFGDVYRAHVATNRTDPTQNEITWVKLGDQLTVEGALQFLGNVAANTPISNEEVIALFE